MWSPSTSTYSKSYDFTNLTFSSRTGGMFMSGVKLDSEFVHQGYLAKVPQLDQ